MRTVLVAALVLVAGVAGAAQDPPPPLPPDEGTLTQNPAEEAEEPQYVLLRAWASPTAHFRPHDSRMLIDVRNVALWHACYGRPAEFDDVGVETAPMTPSFTCLHTVDGTRIQTRVPFDTLLRTLGSDATAHLQSTPIP